MCPNVSFDQYYFFGARVSCIDSMTILLTGFVLQSQMNLSIINRLLKKTMDEISVENRKKGANGKNSVDAVLKELSVQLPEGKTCQLQDLFL